MQRKIETLKAKRFLLGQLRDYIIASLKSDSHTYHNALMMYEAMDQLIHPIREFLRTNPDPEVGRIIDYLDQAKSDKALLTRAKLQSKVIEALEKLLDRTERERKSAEEKITRFKEQTKGESAETKSSALRRTLKIGSIVSIAGLTYYIFKRRKNGQEKKE